MTGAPFALYAIAHPAFAERYNYITRHIAQRSAQKPVILGVIGREVLLRDPEFPRNPAFSPGQLGCALSHVAAYRHMVENGVQQAIILEDDAALPEGFDDLARAILGELRPGEVIVFHSPIMTRHEYSFYGSRRFGKSLLVTPFLPEATRTCLCYAIEIGAARRLLTANGSPRWLADDFGAFYRNGLVNFLRILSPAAVDVAHFESVIGYHGEGSLMQRLAPILNRTPGVRQLLRLRRKFRRMKFDRNHEFRPEPSPLMQGNPNYADE
ncbi:glycosyltransferase family 25 protein [Tabrizicola sp. M-4]|uniref:glycosyltransferase family 25 protein n=1 Tax=Tabrizicola sp. M-4 TaxID=3055847 RepID=UPI003DA92578